MSLFYSLFIANSVAPYASAQSRPPRRHCAMERPTLEPSNEVFMDIDAMPNLRAISKKNGTESAALPAAIVDFSKDAILSKDLNGIITSWNKAAEVLFGYSADEAIGQSIRLIIPDDRWAEEATILKRLKRGQRIENLETVRKHKNGTTLDLSLTISPLRDATGRVVGASKVARDISAQKQTERHMRDTEDRLRTLADELENEVRARTRDLEQRNAEVVQQSEQLRKLWHRLQQTQDDERRRIARELHDSAGQILAALSMNVARIAGQVTDNAVVAKTLEESEALLQQLSQEIRTTSYLLHPPLLDENGLSGAIGMYTDGLAERSGMKIDFRISDSFGRLPNDLELAAFRIVQECLTNIHRHSGSKEAKIRIRRHSDGIQLEIQDNGTGISAERLAAIQTGRSGVGIRSMRERVHHFGGSLQIDSNGIGTTVTISLPCSMSDSRESLSGSGLARAAF